MSELAFSIVIPTYQRCSLLRELLAVLAGQTIPPNRYELIVAVDGSEDGTREMASHFAAPYELRSIWQPNRGRASACNAGIRLARGEIVILLDDDMYPGREFLEGHAAAHQAHPGCAIIGAAPVLIDDSSPPATRYIANRFNQHLANLARDGYLMKFRDFYSGNFSLRRDLFAKVGGFDEDFVVYGNEDLEFSYRLAAAGVTAVFSPAAVATQRYTKDFAGLARDNLGKGRTAVLLSRKHPQVLPHLKIGAPREASLKWRVVRASLLRATEAWPAVASVILSMMQWLERRRSRFFAPSCMAVLDYFYWLGARAAMKEGASGT